MAVDLPADLARKFYEGYANQTLWPLFHSFSTRFDYDAELWAAYVTANRRFRDAVLEQLAPGDTVWIHDYHLMLLPRMLREVAPETRIGFFLHIPFPASELLRILPRRDEVLRGLLGADLLAFQTHADLQHFRASLLRLIGLPSQMDRVVAQGHSTRLEALPDLASPPRSSPTSSSTTRRRSRRSPSCARASRASASSSPSTAWTTPRASPSGCAPSASCWPARRSCGARSPSSRSRCRRGSASPSTSGCATR